MHSIEFIQNDHTKQSPNDWGKVGCCKGNNIYMAKSIQNILVSFEQTTKKKNTNYTVCSYALDMN